MTITEFLLARLVDEEAAWSDGASLTTKPEFARMAEHMLTGCTAARAIVELHAAHPTPQVMTYGTITACSECGSVDDSPVEWPCPTLAHFATPYATHPDYDQAWAPL